MFENYKKNLKPQQVKRFEKILSLYQELRPYYYDDVKIKITKQKHHLTYMKKCTNTMIIFTLLFLILVSF